MHLSRREKLCHHVKLATFLVRQQGTIDIRTIIVRYVLERELFAHFWFLGCLINSFGFFNGLIFLYFFLFLLDSFGWHRLFLCNNQFLLLRLLLRGWLYDFLGLNKDFLRRFDLSFLFLAFLCYILLLRLFWRPVDFLLVNCARISLLGDHLNRVERHICPVVANNLRVLLELLFIIGVETVPCLVYLRL